ncbi:MAG: sugar transferase [Candidatus Dormibacteraeota bacterium]|uniref:Sugar transferase n=1 Tax=Candidatus Aeolococcus gillhamiae TaxID=3127015 RepID=A0A934JY00_9BACT|nr:sugar transferase [Candidatus Dormibacteraeota bacterium]
MDLIGTPGHVQSWPVAEGTSVEVIGRSLVPTASAVLPRARGLDRRQVMIGLLALTFVVDLVAVFIAYFAAKMIHANDWELGPQLLRPIDKAVFLTIPAWPIIFGIYGLYDLRRPTHITAEARQLFHAVIFSVLLVVLVTFVAKLNLSRGFFAALLVFSLVTTISGRLLVRRINHALNARLITSQTTIVVGCNEEGRAIARALARRRWAGYDVRGFIDVAHQGVDTVGGLPVLGSVATISDVVAQFDARVVIVAGTAVGTGMLQQIDDALAGTDISVRVSPGLANLAASRACVEPLDGMALFTLRRRRFSSRARLLKRILDVSIASVMLLFASPVMMVVALLVRLTSSGPALFRQERIGAEGRAFTMWKFRTMVVDAERLRDGLNGTNEADGVLFKLRADPRVTRVGRWLRRFAIDELPQLFNVVRGDMSLVGPRPALPEEALNYDERVRGRLRVKPGLTGLWQVNGRHELVFEDYLRYDLFYVENWSVMMDLYILAKTVPALIAARGSY